MRRRAPLPCRVRRNPVWHGTHGHLPVLGATRRHGRLLPLRQIAGWRSREDLRPPHHGAQYQAEPDHRLAVRRPQLPDRAPPLPEHAEELLAARARHRQAVLPRARIPYAETGPVRSYLEILRYLDEIG